MLRCFAVQLRVDNLTNWIITKRDTRGAVIGVEEANDNGK